MGILADVAGSVDVLVGVALPPDVGVRVAVAVEPVGVGVRVAVTIEVTVGVTICGGV